LSASANLTITGDYRYLFKIFDNPKLLYGWDLKLYAQYNLSLYPNWDESHLYWANHIDLGAENMLILRVSESEAAA